MARTSKPLIRWYEPSGVASNGPGESHSPSPRAVANAVGERTGVHVEPPRRGGGKVRPGPRRVDAQQRVPDVEEDELRRGVDRRPVPGG